MTQVEVSERPNDSERKEIEALVTRADAASSHETLSEHKRLQLHQKDGAEYVSVLIREDTTEALIGYAHLAHSTSGFALELVVDPNHRNSDNTVAKALLAVAIAEAKRHGGGPLQFFLPKPTPEEVAFGSESGLVISRELLQLRVGLPLVQTVSAPPITTRAFRVGEDEASLLSVNARAFADHPDQGTWDIGEITARENEPWFDREGLLVYEDGGQFVGFCWTKIHEGDERLGEIYVIAVDPSVQHQGLGRSLVLAGLSYLAGKGLHAAMLYVDRDNIAAVRLYESLGFLLDHRDVVFSGHVADAP